MAAQLYSAVKGLQLVIDPPIEGGIVRDDFIRTKVWYHLTNENFNPQTEGTLGYDGDGLNVFIPNLDPSKTYFIKYALFSSLDETVFNDSEALSGKPLSGTSTVSLSTDTQVFTYLATGLTPSPGTATITATTQNLSGTLYYQFLLAGTQVQIGTSNTYTYTPQANHSSMPQQLVVKVRQVTGTAEDTVLAQDYISLIGVKPGNDGDDALSGLLTNESATVAAAANGDLASGALTNAGGTFKVFSGTTDVTTSAAFSIVANPSDINVTIGASTGVYAINSLPVNSATVTFQAVYSGATIQKVYSISKSLAGSDGDDALSGLLTNESATVPAAPNGDLASGALTNAGGTFKVFSGTTDVTTSAAFSIVGTPSDINVTIGASTGVYTITALTANTATVTFQAVYNNVTIQKVYSISKSLAGSNGTSARSVDLTATTQAFAYPSNGTGATPANTTVTATAQNTSGTVYYEFFKGTASVQNTTTNTYSYEPKNTYAEMPEQITVKIREGSDSSSVLAQDTISMIAIKPGVNGSSARSVDLTATTQAFAYPSNGTGATPANTTVTATAQNTSGTVYYEFFKGTTSVQNTTTNTYTYEPKNAYAEMPEQITVKIREGSDSSSVLAQDTISMIAIKPGVNAITGFLTNEAASISTNSEGTVPSGGLTNAGGTFKVFNGTTDVTTSAAFSIVGTLSNIDATINSTTGVYTINSLAIDSATVTFQAVYNGVTIQKIYSISKSKTGIAKTLLISTDSQFIFPAWSTYNPFINYNIIYAGTVQKFSGTISSSYPGMSGASGLDSAGIGVYVFGSSGGGIIARTITTRTRVFLADYTSVRLTIQKAGSNGTTSWGDQPDTTDDLNLLYSTDGTSWSVLKAFSPLEFATNNTWYTFNIELPSQARVSGGVFFRISQSSFDYATANDNWAVRDDIRFIKLPNTVKLNVYSSGLTGEKVITTTSGSIELTAPSTISESGLTEYTLTWNPVTSSFPVTINVSQNGVSQNIVVNAEYTPNDIITCEITNPNCIVRVNTDGTKDYALANGTFRIFKNNVNINGTGEAYFYITGGYGISITLDNTSGGYSVTNLPNDGGGASVVGFYKDVLFERSIVGKLLYSGIQGSQGKSSRIAYAKSTTATASGGAISTTGNTSYPPNNSWVSSSVWTDTPPSLLPGEYLYQSDGVYDPVTNVTTWSQAYWSSLKVGSLSALSANIGSCTAGTLQNAAGTFIINLTAGTISISV